MLKVLLVRHGMTPGNKLSRYIGRTDEPLLEEGIALLEEKKEKIREVMIPDRLFVSPMKRCRQTAEIFFGDMQQQIIDDLREFDFGIFENKNYKELSGSGEYQSWVDSFCEAPVPGGESMAIFKSRCCAGLDQIIASLNEAEYTDGKIAVVVHGGTIMSLMDLYSEEKKSYYDWSVKNGEGYLVELDPVLWKQGKKIFVHGIKV
ncbi:MAG: histidine phosphatase family protein [Clostridiales bacterium]|nr:histidine phosphatase family protein [Candidatus Blautia equi]